MDERIHEAVDGIFMDYEDTPALRDFKEEIAMNLSEHVSDMTNKGVGVDAAIKKALAELGDITEAADEVSRQKRKEVIGQAFAKPAPLDKLHAFGYPIAGVLLVFGIIVCAIAAFSTNSVMKAIGSLMPFAVIAIGGFVYLGLTQETRTHYPMSRKRGLVYTLASMLLALGGFLCGIVLFVDTTVYELSHTDIPSLKASLISLNPVATLGTLIPFVLPAAALLAFLVLTEKSRKKPWVIRMEEESQTIYGESYGLLSGALWIAAIGLFVLMGMLIGWHIAWIIFIFAIAMQCLLQYFTAKKHGK